MRTIREIDHREIDAVSGGAFFIPLFWAGIKAGLASKGVTVAAAKFGAALGTAGAAAGLAVAGADDDSEEAK
jgi:hypothetical protein